jgi:ubiquitin C-terminal hydrolase
MNLSSPLSNKGNSLRIFDLLQSYFSEEVIDGVECDTCKKKTSVRRSRNLYNEPDMLVLHLNRFSRGYYSNIKNKACIKFDDILGIPVNIVHPNRQKVKLRYKLIGTINHVGSINAGHYYAIKKDKASEPIDGLCVMTKLF